MRPLFFLLFVALVALSSCNSIRPFYGKEYKNWRSAKIDTAQPKTLSLFLVGDAGKLAKTGVNPVMPALKTHLAQTNNPLKVLYLGDNIYPYGLPDSSQKEAHADGKKSLDVQLDAAKGYEDKAYFLPGNHDWANGKEEGYSNLLRQEKYVEEKLDNPAAFLTENGCPGPYEVQVNDKLVFIAYDTQWWLHDKTKPTDNCSCKTREEIAAAMKALFEKNKDKQIVLLGHHPFISNSTHGGHIPFKHYMFPLLLGNKYLWIPLPPLGLVYGFYRSVIGHPQDMPNKRYRKMKKMIWPLLKAHPNAVYVSGHDHNLQYHKRDGIHYVVSGSGSKIDYVAQGHKAGFTHAHKGYFKMDYYQNGQVVLEAWEPDAENKPVLLFRSLLY